MFKYTFTQYLFSFPTFSRSPSDSFFRSRQSNSLSKWLFLSKHDSLNSLRNTSIHPFLIRCVLFSFMSSRESHPVYSSRTVQILWSSGLADFHSTPISLSVHDVLPYVHVQVGVCMCVCATPSMCAYVCIYYNFYFPDKDYPVFLSLPPFTTNTYSFRRNVKYM